MNGGKRDEERRDWEEMKTERRTKGSKEEEPMLYNIGSICGVQFRHRTLTHLAISSGLRVGSI